MDVLTEIPIAVTRENYVQIAGELKLSYAVLKRLANVRPQILLSDDACFYDIETEKNKFTLGVVNDRLFTDPAEMLKYIQRFDVCCGFNTYRYDNEVLYRHKNMASFFKTIDYRNFILHKIGRCINIDLLPVYMLHSPFSNRHRLDDLAKELNVKRQCNDYTEEKCREDVQIIQKFYPIAKELLNWIETSFFVDPETICVLYYKDFVKLRRWCLQSWMLQHGIYPKLIKVEDDRKPSFYRSYRKGFFGDINVFDVRSSYPTTAVNLNCSIYRSGDFAEYERFLLEQRDKCQRIGTFIKWLGNATIGDQNYTDGLLYNKKIMIDVWLEFKKVMTKWIEQIGKENVIFAYTDSIFTKLSSVPEIPPYTVQLKHKYKWVAIYNQIRYVAQIKDTNSIHKVHFDRKLNLKLFDYMDEKIHEKLLDDPIAFIKDPKLDTSLADFPEDTFKIVVFKKDNVCRNIEYLLLWNDFEYGLNNAYLSRKGLTQDPKKICFARYQKFYDYYLGLFKLSGGEIEA